MAVKKWSKKQRAKFMATLKARKAAGGWGRGRTKKPYRKPGRITRSSAREVLIRSLRRLKEAVDGYIIELENNRRSELV